MRGLLRGMPYGFGVKCLMVEGFGYFMVCLIISTVERGGGVGWVGGGCLSWAFLNKKRIKQ
ncbi:hypothetical protein HanIR_Chr01g0027821 [Helianthus annuus]|nr:hypothetical protein HanIR_Chr01g0027821 [Helianthus annuus]